MNLQELCSRHERVGSAATFLYVLKAAQRVADEETTLNEQRDRVRRNVALPDAWFPELAGLANEIGPEDPRGRFALAEMAQAASVANCGLVLRNLLSLKLAVVPPIPGKLERSRQAYTDVIEGVEILNRFFRPYHGVLFDYDEQDARSIEEAARSGWNQARAYSDATLDLFDVVSGDPAREWMDLLAWNCDAGEDQGLLAQVDATSRLALRFEHWSRTHGDSMQRALRNMRAQFRLMEQEDARVALRYLVTVADALIEGGQWALAGETLDEILDRELARQDEPIGLHAMLQAAYCYLRSGDVDCCERCLQEVDSEKLGIMSKLILTMAGESARYTALQCACRAASGKNWTIGGRAG